MTTRRIYLASSWRNTHQAELVAKLREEGFEVYDFRNPTSGGPVTSVTPVEGFSWRQCDPAWREAPNPFVAYRAMLDHPAAERGFAADFEAMRWADTCVLLLPSGRSAHIEAGWMVGAGKRLVVYQPTLEGFEPELMYLVGGAAKDVLAADERELLRLLDAEHIADHVDARTAFLRLFDAAVAWATVDGAPDVSDDEEMEAGDALRGALDTANVAWLAMHSRRRETGSTGHAAQPEAGHPTAEGAPSPSPGAVPTSAARGGT